MHKKPWTILSTGFISPEIIEQLSSDHISVDMIPFTETTIDPSSSVRDRILELSQEMATIVFTSANAVQAVISHLVKKPAWKIFCTSGPTRQLTEAFFGKAAIVDIGERAFVIAEKMIAAGVREAVFFCGAQRLEELPKALHKNQVNLEECIVYTTKPTPQRLQKEYDALLFYSPMAVDGFFSINKLPETTQLFALGATTTAAIRKYSTKDILQAPVPEKTALLKTAIHYFTLNIIQGSR